MSNNQVSIIVVKTFATVLMEYSTEAEAQRDVKEMLALFKKNGKLTITLQASDKPPADA